MTYTVIPRVTKYISLCVKDNLSFALHTGLYILQDVGQARRDLNTTLNKGVSECVCWSVQEAEREQHIWHLLV